MFFFAVNCMPVFIVLGNWTDQGIKKVKKAPDRIKDTHSAIEQSGGKMQLYYTLGEYDFVMVIEAPNDEAIMRILLRLGSLGNVRTKTLKAWTESEGAKAISPMPSAGWFSKIGFQSSPLLVVFHKFPEPKATYMVPGAFGSACTASTLAEFRTGPAEIQSMWNKLIFLESK